MEEDEFPCLEKVLTVSVTDPLISCSAVNSDYEIVAFVLRTGDLILYALRFGKNKPIIRWIPWIDNVEKRLTAICFNPVEGEAILAVCSDRSLYVILSLALINAFCNDETSEEGFPSSCRDIVSLPSPILGETDGKPVAVAWWVRSSAKDSTKHTAIVGFTHGLIVAFAIYTGIVVFKTSIEGRVCKIDVCSKPGKSFILVTNDLGRQWRITLNEIEEESSTSNVSSHPQEHSRSFIYAKKIAHITDTLDCDSEARVTENQAIPSRVEAEEKEIIPCKKEFKLNIVLQKLSKAYFSISNNYVIGSHEANLITVDKMTAGVKTVHTLPHRYSLLVPTNSLLVFADDKLTTITVISQEYSKIKAKWEGINLDYDGEAFIQEFEFDSGEKIRNLFCTDCAKEQCSVVTNQGIYCLRLKKTPRDLVLHNILSSKNLRLAEKHSSIFNLDVQKMLCEAGDIRLRENSLDEASRLYSLARGGSAHHVAMLAVVGLMDELLNALQSSKFRNTNVLQLTNMKFLVFVHQYLTNYSPRLHNEFREFLTQGDYDESCAISIIAQASLCEELRLVMRIKGLQQTVLLCLANIVRNKSTFDILKCKEFWELMSDESLGETLLTKQNLVIFHAQLVQKNLKFFDKFILEKLERLYNPFAHSIRNFIANIVTTDIPLKLWMETYLLICVQLSSLLKEFSGTFGLYKEHGFLEVKPKVPFVPQNLYASFNHAYVLIRGNAYGWGCSLSGCLGVGPTNQYVSGPKVLDRLVSLKKRVLGISCGRNHSVALTNDGVYSWGSNKYGQLGVSEVMQSWYPVAVSVLFDSSIISVCAGQYHSLALDDENRVFSWGWGVHGQLGHGDVEDVFKPKIISSLNGKNIIAMAAGQMHSVFLDAAGRVWACGSNAFGQLGIGDMKKSTLPVPLYGFTESVVMISCGYFQNCAVSTEGKVYQWGRSPNALRTAAHSAKRRLRSKEYSKEHALILKEHSEYLIPKLVDTLTVNGKIIKVAIGGEHSIALTDEGSLYCWGRNADGQLGVSIPSVERQLQNVVQPTLINIGAKIVDVACGWDFSVALDSCQNVWTWGANIHAKANPHGSLAAWEGEIVTVNNRNRVIKLPHSTDNVQTVPAILSISTKEPEQPMYHPVELPEVLKNNDWRTRMHFAMEKCVALYNPSLICQQCISIGEHDACSKLSLILGDLKTATIEKLNSAKTELDQETVLRYFLPLAIDNPSQLNCVLESIVTYWLERDLPTACFEKVFSCYLDQLTKPLGILVFGVNSEVNQISKKLSTEFKLRLVKNMFQFDKENIVCVMKDFTDFDAAMVALENPGDFIDISADQISKLCSESKQKLFVRLN